MKNGLIHQLLVRRHFWRHATFDEVAELYASRVLRMAAIYIAATFMSIYLYQNGYSIVVIGLFWACMYGLKALISVPLAALTARIGPKHSIFVSNLLYIPAMISFAFVPQFGVLALIPTLVFQALSTALYAIAYAIDFSKVKSLEHAGKEIAYMNIFEKITAGLSPVVGGVLAFLFGPQVVLVLAALLFALAAVPLFKTGEPVKVGARLKFTGFPWRLLLRQSLAQWSIGFDVFASGTVWALYTAILILGISADSDAIYAKTGALLSVVLIAALISSYVFGKLIDKRRGRELMYVGSISNALTHLLRPFIVSPVSVAGLNAANEVATTAYTLPYTRAVFDNADLSGARTTYIGMIEVLSNTGACIAALVLAIGAWLVGETLSLQGFFFIASGVALLILTARFPLYKR